jgi:CubicO group peptidase (beta-lactamase class C family)
MVWADRVTRQPVTAATRFQAASLSKPVTAWGVLRLVEQGRIG